MGKTMMIIVSSSRKAISGKFTQSREARKDFCRDVLLARLI